MENTNQAFLQSIIVNATKQSWSVNETQTHDVQDGILTGTIQKNIYLYPPTGCCITQSVNGNLYPHIHIYYKLGSQDINYVLSYVDGEKVVHGTGKWDRGDITINHRADQAATKYIGDFLNLCKSCDIRAPMPMPRPTPTPLIKSVIGKDTIKKSSSSSKTNFTPRAVHQGKSVNAPVRVIPTIQRGGKSTRRRQSNTHRRIKQKKRKTKKNNSRRRKNTRK